MGAFFANPGMLAAGAAGAAIPLIIHLLNRQRYRRVRWAAMDFLLNAIKKTRRRLQLENLILLLIRMALMALLAMAIARPLLNPAAIAGAESDRHHVVVLDNSFSMGIQPKQETAFDKAKKSVEKIIEELREGEKDRFSLVTMSDAPQAIIAGGTNRKDAAISALKDVELSMGGTSVPRTAVLIRDILRQSTNSTKIVYFVTDMQRNSWDVEAAVPADEESDFGGGESTVARDAFLEILKEISDLAVEVVLIDVGEEETQNRAIKEIRLDRRQVLTTRGTAKFHAVVQNFGDLETTARASLYVDDALHETRDVVLKPRVESSVEFDYEFTKPGPHRIRIALENDILAIDDVRYMAVDVKEAVKVLVVDSGSSADTAIFRFSLNPTGDPFSRKYPFSVTYEDMHSFSDHNLDEYDLVVLGNVPTLSVDLVNSLEAFVQAGGGLMVGLGPKIDRLTWNEYFYKDGEGLLPIKLTEEAGDPEQKRILTMIQPDFDHPAIAFFRPFPGNFTDLPVFQYIASEVKAEDPSVRVLSRFSVPEEHPALVEKTFGQGKVLVWTSTLSHDWNHLIQTSTYPILIHEISRYLSARASVSRNIEVGEHFHTVLGVEELAKEFRLETPDEGFVTLWPAPLKSDDKFFELRYPALLEELAEEEVGEGEEKVVERNADEKLFDLPEPGVRLVGQYSLVRPGVRPDEAPETGEDLEDKLLMYFAVNVEAEEGDLQRVTESELQTLFPGFKFRTISEAGEENNQPIQVLPQEGNLWRFLLFGVLGLLLLESFCAWKFGSGRG